MNNLNEFPDVSANPRVKNRKLSERFNSVRDFTEELCKPLINEDYIIQSMPDASPAKWHLAHTTWFFETFILNKYIRDYHYYNDVYNYLFNSYYVQVGERFIRKNRGLLSRPSVEDVYNYRKAINEQMLDFLDRYEPQDSLKFLVELGLNHEQQHQELILTDIKHLFSANPLYPVYAERKRKFDNGINRLNWISIDEGLYEIGDNEDRFVFDNETPKHKIFQQPFRISDRLITNHEYLQFINDKGYKRPELWLSDGWTIAENEKWEAPLYWNKIENEWWVFSLNGLNKLLPDEPLCHVSFYEADAFARWSGFRLPTEQEWEIASKSLVIQGNFVGERNFHPVPLQENVRGLKQFFGDTWEWTSSSYSPYPGYKTLPGALGEYNGKFMSNQYVLRGGSCATPVSHIRPTYRNFFHPDARWQFSGIRLANDEV